MFLIILWHSVHLSMGSPSFFYKYFAEYSSQATGCFSHKNIEKTTSSGDSSSGESNPSILRKESAKQAGNSTGNSNQQPLASCLVFCQLHHWT